MITIRMLKYYQYCCLSDLFKTLIWCILYLVSTTETLPTVTDQCQCTVTRISLHTCGVDIATHWINLPSWHCHKLYIKCNPNDTWQWWDLTRSLLGPYKWGYTLQIGPKNTNISKWDILGMSFLGGFFVHPFLQYGGDHGKHLPLKGNFTNWHTVCPFYKWLHCRKIDQNKYLYS